MSFEKVASSISTGLTKISFMSEMSSYGNYFAIVTETCPPGSVKDTSNAATAAKRIIKLFNIIFIINNKGFFI